MAAAGCVFGLRFNIVGFVFHRLAAAFSRLCAHFLSSLVLFRVTESDVDVDAYVNECNGFADTEEKAKEEAAKRACRVLHSMRLLSILASSPEPGAIDDIESEHEDEHDTGSSGGDGDGGDGSSRPFRSVKSTDSLERSDLDV